MPVRTSVSLGPASLGIHDFDEFSSGAGISEIAVEAERLGFDAIHVTEHPAPSERGLAEGGHHAPDSFVTLAVAAAHTSRIKLQTHLTVLPYRNPFILAKAVATLDLASGGRVILGAGAGYLEDEFRALGASFAERNELTDEVLEVLPKIWRGEPFSFSGRYFEADRSVSLPRPVQDPHPPIWLGGNSKKAIRRAARFGQGWAPFPNPPGEMRVGRSPSIFGPDDLRVRIGYLREAARGYGRTGALDVAFALGYKAMWEGRTATPEEMITDARELVAAGVTWLLVPLSGGTREEFLVELGQFSSEVLGVTRALEPDVTPSTKG
jgi:probable F420-dependent oxidoreductase